MLVWTEDVMPSFPYHIVYDIGLRDDILTLRFKHMTKDEIQYDALKPAVAEIDLVRFDPKVYQTAFIVNRETPLGQIDLVHHSISVEDDKWIIAE